MSQSRISLLLVALALPALVYHERPARHVPVDLESTERAAQPEAAWLAFPASHSAAAAEPVQQDTAFGRLIERLSEEGGYFDSDNLISNEASYLHVIGKLERLGVQGGAYVGVGPDQNFSYIAQIRPNVAFMIDIRRDNLLQHFLFKALFARARNRLEYLCLLFGKPAPRDLARWEQRDIGQLLAYIDTVSSTGAFFQRTLTQVAATAKSFGYPLSESDLGTIRRFHSAFYDAGLDLRFSSYGRSPRSYYPTYRQLLLEKDLDGRQASYLVDEEDFQFLKSLHARNRIIPVVGDLAGDHALAAIASYLRAHDERLSAFYTSNVEFYLMAGDSFDRFARNVTRLPRDAKSVIIRSYFGRGYPHPQAVPGYYSTQLMQSMEAFVRDEAAGGYRSYSDLVVRNVMDLRS
ncbi:MAG: hypothetical protein ACREMQ_09030 [Longimicrobiales bacterium]